jgi:hypothetical protein
VPTLSIAALLVLASLSVSGRVLPGSTIQRVSAATVTTLLALRGAIGFSGVIPRTPQTESFIRWDRRLYSPLCLSLGLLSSFAIRR